MARRGENIYHRKDGRWEGRYIVGRNTNGKPKYKSIYGKNYSVVKQELVVQKFQHLNADNTPPVLVYGNGSVSDWMDYWLNVIEKPYIRQTTYQLYKRNIDKHLRPLLGEFDLAKLDKNQIQHAVDCMRRTISQNTLHGVCRQLKNMLSHAVRENLITKSPYEEIRLPKHRKCPPRVLTTAEQEMLEREAVSGGVLEILFCLYTGIRLGELCALQYGDIDFIANTLRVSHSVKRVTVENKEGCTTRLIVGDTKSESSKRVIPMPLFLLKMIKERKRMMSVSNEEFIFNGIYGEVADPRTVQNRLMRITNKLGIKGVHMHTLRHTFAMRALECGMGYKALSEILGHSSSRITMEHYDNCTWESKQKLMVSAKMIA